MIDRETAVRALRDAAKDPSAFSTEELKMLMDAAETPEAPKSTEPTSLLGPTGMDMLEKQIPVAPEAADIGAMMDKYPGAKSAFGGRLTDFSQGNPLSDIIEERNKTHDDNLPNASKRKDFTAPPEFFPPPPEALPTNPIEAFGLKLSNARNAMPGILGGKVEHFLEPSLEQFQRDMGQYVHPSEMHHGSDAYREYADDLWQKVHDQAKAENRPVVRDAYKKDKSWTTQAGDFVAKQTVGLASGLNDILGGVPAEAADVLMGKPFQGDSAENMNRLGESAPAARTAGQVGGSMLPMSPGGLAARGASAALPEAAGFLGATARAGAVGAAAGGAQAGAMGEDMGSGALFGLPLGMIGGGLGYGAKAQGKNLRETTTLGQAERAGTAETSALFGVKPTEAAKGIRKESYLQSGEPGRETDMLAQRLEGQVLEGGRKLDQATQRDIGQAQKQYFDLTKEVREPATPLVKEAMRLHSTGFSSDGRELPLHDQQSKFLRDAIAKSTSAEVVPSSGGKANVRSTGGGSFDLSAEEAKMQGIDVERAMKDYMASGGDAPGDFVVRVTPQKLNPEETERIIAKIGDYLDQGDADKKRALNSLMPFSRQVRDQFPAAGPISGDITARVGDAELKGWSAFQHQASERIGKTQKTLEDAGLPSKVPDELNSNQDKALSGAIRGYGKAGRSPDLDQALRDLADPKKLEEMRGMGNLPKLEAQGTMFPSAYMRSSGTGGAVNLQGARFHLDPFLESIAPPLLSGRAGSAGAVLGRDKKALPEQLDQATLEKLRAIFGPGGPF